MAGHPRPQAGSFSSKPSQGELSAGGAIPRAVADVEEALEGAEDDFAVGFALEGEVRFLDEVKEVVAPGVHLDKAPAAGESFGEGGDLCHQWVSASSLGSRTRL